MGVELVETLTCNHVLPTFSLLRRQSLFKSPLEHMTTGQPIGEGIALAWAIEAAAVLMLAWPLQPVAMWPTV